MRVKWTVTDQHPELLRTFLREQGISRKLLAKLKCDGDIWLNNKEAIVTQPIAVGDSVEIRIPAESRNETIIPSSQPLDILYEDDAFLIINKPHSYASVPAPNHRLDTMVNRVAYYIQEQQYTHQAIHVVTRLDRDTSGVMMFAKNGYIHALMDQQLRQHQLHKSYIAVLHGQLTTEHDVLTFPIGRSQQSIIERVVDYGDSGKFAKTEYWLKQANPELSVVNVKLWTGRTHQIRVHFSHIGFPLLGDDLYGGTKDLINRQALHCQHICFIHPLTGQELDITAPLPDDILSVLTDKKTIAD